MALEIERKFLLEKLPEWVVESEPISITQAYLSLDQQGREVRIRQKDTSYWLTVKGDGAMEREEYEVALNQEQFDQLWPARLEPCIRKKRYLANLEDLVVEIDIYQQPLEGLMIAEIEFDSKAQALAFVPFEWLGKEVTHLNFLKNKNLLSFESFEDVQQLL